MLYNKNWDAKTVTSDPFSLESLIAWLEKQPAERAYRFIDCGGACLLDQYITSATGERSVPSKLHHTICGGVDNYATIAARSPHTFGAALTRARQALAERE